MLPSRIGPESNYAICYLDDVNRDMPGVKAGDVRYLRISEHLQWFFGKKDDSRPDTLDAGHPTFARNFGYWTWSPTRVIGTVPVEKDGSAYFKVPAGLAIYFQALDENMMEIRRMRSHVEFKPGEVRGCVGCHETKQHVPRRDSRRSKLAFGTGTLSAQAAALGRRRPPRLREADPTHLRPALRPLPRREAIRRRASILPAPAILTALCNPIGRLFGIEQGHADSLGRRIPGSFCRYAAPRPGGGCRSTNRSNGGSTAPAVSSACRTT